MPENLNFIDDSKLINSQKKYTSEGKNKSKMIKFTTKSKDAFRRAVKNRLVNSIGMLTEDKEALVNEYKDTYSQLESNFKQSIEQKKNDIEVLSNDFDYLAKLGVKIVETDRKLKNLNSRLTINGKKTANLKGETFKKIVSSISKLKNTLIDKYVDKRNITDKFETYKDNIDELMSQGRYYTAEKELRKMGNYDSMVYGSRVSGPMEDIYTNTIDSIKNNEGLQEKPIDNAVNNDSQVKKEEIKTLEEIENQIFNTFQQQNTVPVTDVMPGLENVEENNKEEQVEKQETVEIKKEESVEDVKPAISTTNSQTFGIDFTKLIKPKPEQVQENVPMEDNANQDLNEVQNVVEAIPEEEPVQFETPVVDEIKQEAALTENVEIEQVAVDRLDFGQLANELGVDLELSQENTNDEIVKDEAINEIIEKEETLEKKVKPSKEIEGQVGFEDVQLAPEESALESESLIPEDPSAALVEMFKNIDNITDELNKYKEDVIAKIDFQAQKSIEEIEKQAEDLQNSDVIENVEPIVLPSEEPIVEEKAVIEGEEVKLDHELLKKLYDMVTVRDAEILELKALLQQQRQMLTGEVNLDSNTFDTSEEVGGKKM